jgi:Endonuclease I
VAGHTYRVRVTAVTGAGEYNGCWTLESGACDVPTPPGGACPGTVPDASSLGLPAGYYDQAQDQCGPELLTALAAIASSQRVLGYTSARDSMYAYVDDLNDDDVIEDLYTGRLAGAVNSRATAFLAHFDAEHTWPRSRGAGEDPAMSDLNIIFASDSTANAMRLNYPFGIVTGGGALATNAACCSSGAKTTP